MNKVDELLSKFVRDEIKKKRLEVAIRRLIAKGTEQEVNALLYLLGKCSNMIGSIT